MIESNLAKMTNVELAALFVESCQAENLGRICAESDTINFFIDRQFAIRNELKSRTPDARVVLLALLQHKDPSVRFGAAVAILALAPEKAITTLETIEADPTKPYSTDAWRVLYRYRSGEFKPT
ncbi:MAG TPA: DUF2019 domain-containing protein [Blastocatellia bacterium]|nr:DUF2019 domain-containing protein [Blastocatellia bacterium]